MPKFRKKAIVIEARQWDGTPEGAIEIIDWILGNGGSAYFHEYHKDHDPSNISVETLEGTMRAMPDDWIIEGVQGEFYPCKANIFDETYDMEE